MRNKRHLLNLVAVLSFTVANLTAGVNSWMLFYQPQMPKQLRKEA